MDRMDKVNQLIKREVGKIVQMELQDPRIEFVTITNVDVSRDLRHARISFSVLGDEKQAERALRGLDNASRYIRKVIGQRITIRYTPEIQFVLDNSIRHSANIEKTFEEIHNENKKDS